jgi:nucleoporin SEH1
MPGLYKVAWAHPEFGQLIAVAHDRLVWLFEELCHGNNKNLQGGWIKRTPGFLDARATITDIKFAPKLLGLQLIVTTANGEARIYDCMDNISSSSTNHGSLQQEIKINMDSCSSCSWSTCLNLPVLLAFGCDSSHSMGSSKLAIFEYNDISITYSKIDVSLSVCQDPIRSIAFAPSVGKLFHTLAVASKSLIVLTIKPMYVKKKKKKIFLEKNFFFF